MKTEWRAVESLGVWWVVESSDLDLSSSHGRQVVLCGDNEALARRIARLPKLEATGSDLLEACRRAARSEHHPTCPIPRGRGQTTVTHDDCTCHVKAARAAIAKAEGKGGDHE